MTWDLSCRDWADRLKQGRSLVPDLPIDQAQGARAVAVFNKLRLADVPGTPTMEEAGGDWFRDIVRVLFGSLDPVTRARAIRELMVLVPKKNSKALALDTLLATPQGFTTMGEVQAGDAVIDAAGRPAAVLDKSEVFVCRDCYEVEFSTGERVVCDAQHLWVTDAHTDRERQPRDLRSRPCPGVKTTAQIAECVKVASGDLQISNHRTSLCGALDLPQARLPIPPYALGVWLGDGATDAAVVTAGASDAGHIIAALIASGQPAQERGCDPQSGAVRISLAGLDGQPLRERFLFLAGASGLGLLGNKGVPSAYLRASAAQRLELLRGLMDSDGSISAAGQASFVSTLPALRDGVIELVNSLGLKASASEHRATLDGRDCGPCWRVQFWPFAEPLVFTLPRKAERQRASQAENARRSRTRQIVSVLPVESVPTQCISVSSETKQFLVTRSLIPTHNTTNSALLMLTALLLNERPNATMIMTAPVHDVAQLAFDAAAGAIALDPVLCKKLHVRAHLKTIVHRQTKSELQIMSFDPAALTGQKPIAALIDELHVVAKMSKAASAIRQLRGGMLPFPEAFLAFITTQSEEAPAGVFHAELQKARAIRDGRQEGAMLPVLYELPQEMQRDKQAWRDPAHWPMVTPNAGRSISIARLVEEFNTAEATSEAELRAWASQHLNVEIGLALHSDRWAGADYWEQQGTAGLTLDELLRRSEVVTVGIDGGGLDDLLGLCVLGRERVSGNWLVWSRAWVHPIALERRKAEAGRFRDFAADGDLRIVQHIGEDVQEVADIAAQVEQSGLLDKIGVDPVGIASIVEAIEARGIGHDRFVGISQGWKMSGAIKTTERRLAEGTLHHGGTRLMAWCVGNAKVEPRGNAITITKQAAGYAKIDPLMALLNAVTLMALNPQAAGLEAFLADPIIV